LGNHIARPGGRRILMPLLLDLKLFGLQKFAVFAEERNTFALIVI